MECYFFREVVYYAIFSQLRVVVPMFCLPLSQFAVLHIPREEYLVTVERRRIYIEIALVNDMVACGLQGAYGDDRRELLREWCWSTTLYIPKIQVLTSN